ARAELCEAVLAAAAEEERACAAAADARATAGRRAGEEGFADLAEAAGALLAPGELAALEAAVRDHEQARAVHERVLADPELADLPARPDLQALGEACAAATDRREEAVAAAQRLHHCMRALDELAGELV